LASEQHSPAGNALGKPPLWARRHPLDLEDAATRTTAYVYGNILVLAALVAQSTEDVTTGRALWVVLGTSVSTFVAHVFAEAMGDQVRSDDQPTLRKGLKLARESLPVLTSGYVPAVFLLAGWLTILPDEMSIWLAEAVVLLRIAGTGIIVARLRNERSSFRLICIGVAMAVVCTLISGLKVYLTH
jgi:hypothetical protein